MATKGTIGVVGTGIMGAPMAVNLAKAGYDVIAYNRTPAKAEALVGDGVRVARSIAEVGAASPVGHRGEDQPSRPGSRRRAGQPRSSAGFGRSCTMLTSPTGPRRIA